MQIFVRNNSDNVVVINDLGSLKINPGEQLDLIELFGSRLSLYDSNDLLIYISNETLIVNDGIEDLTKTEGIRLIYQVNEIRDQSGKLFVHESSRIRGTTAIWTGQGDDANNPSDVGNGQRLIYHHNVGDSTSEILYLDFNTQEKSLYLHEEYFFWENCNFDSITFTVVSRSTSIF